MPDMPRVAPGQPFRPSASAMNRTAAVVEDVEAWKRTLGLGNLPAFSPPVIIDVKNGSGTDIPLYGIVEPSGCVFVPTDNLVSFQNRPAVVGAVPTAACMGRFGVALTPIAAGRVGQVLFSGLTVCQVDITDRNVNEVAEIVGDVSKLRTAAHGTGRIIARESGTSGTKWALVQLGVGREPGIRWKPTSTTLVGGSDPPKYKYTLKRVVTAADGTISLPTGTEQVYGWNDWEDQANPWHGQSDTPGADTTITVAGPVQGPVRADFAGVFDGDGTPIYRFDAPNPMESACGSVLDSGGLSQAQAENIAEGT